MLLIPHTSRHIAQTRDVNSREINFPGGKQISQDSIGTWKSVYKHVVSVLVSFKVGSHVFASRCSLQSPIAGPHSGPRAVHGRCASASHSPSPVDQAPVLTDCILTCHALWAWEKCYRVHCAMVSVSGTYALGEHRACQILLLTITCNKNFLRTSCVCSLYYTQKSK